MVLDPYSTPAGAVISLAGARRIAVPLVADTLRPDIGGDVSSAHREHPPASAQQPLQPDRHRLQPGRTVGHRRVRARANDLLVIADEAYEHLWFDNNNRHIPIARCGDVDRTVTIVRRQIVRSPDGKSVGH